MTFPKFLKLKCPYTYVYIHIHTYNICWWFLMQYENIILRSYVTCNFITSINIDENFCNSDLNQFLTFYQYRFLRIQSNFWNNGLKKLNSESIECPNILIMKTPFILTINMVSYSTYRKICVSAITTKRW
jgi:hypothetical protein